MDELTELTLAIAEQIKNMWVAIFLSWGAIIVLFVLIMARY